MNGLFLLLFFFCCLMTPTVARTQYQSLSFHIDFPVKAPIHLAHLQDGNDYVSAGLICLNSSESHSAGWIGLYNTNGVLWSHLVDSDDSFTPISANLQVLHGSGDIILVLKGFTDSASVMRVHRFARANGSLTWARNIVCTGSEGAIDFMELDDLQMAPDNTFLATYAQVNFLQVVKFTADGDTLFARKINTVDQTNPVTKNPGFDFKTLADGSGYIGTFKWEGHPTVVRFNNDLSVQWAKRWDMDYFLQPRCITELDNGNFVMAGFIDIGSFLAVIDPSGNLLDYYLLPDQLGIDHIDQWSDETVFVSGWGYCALIDLTTASGSLFASSNTASGFKPGISGISVWCSRDMMNGDETVVRGFNIDTHPCVIGKDAPQTLTPLNSGPVTDVTVYAKRNGELTTYTPVLSPLSMTVSNECLLSTNQVVPFAANLSPNPAGAGSTLSISGFTRKGTLSLTDLSGKIIMEFPVDDTTEMIDLPAAKPGMYLLRYTSRDGLLSGCEKLIVE